jgi:hypothetical protein
VPLDPYGLIWRSHALDETCAITVTGEGYNGPGSLIFHLGDDKITRLDITG